MAIHKINRNTHAIVQNISHVDDPRYLLCISDIHFDAMKCDRELLFKHLKMAQERKAYVLMFGDIFDLMQGRFDPRGNYSELRPEYKKCVYVDEVIQDVADKLAPYADVIKFLGRGNHETNIEKRMMVSPLDRLAALLNNQGGEVHVGGYAGWLLWRVARDGANTSTRNIHYHHGYGGNAKRSKGVLSADIDQKDFPDADYIVRGHDHQKWHLPVMVDRLSTRGVLEQRAVHHMRLGSYKSLGDRYAGWATEKGFATPRLGGWWIKVERKDQGWQYSVEEAH